jgi:hypothetical protein
LRAAITYFRLVIIGDLDVKGVTATPSEADPPLLVDPYAVIALSIALKSLELVRAWKRYDARVLECARSCNLFDTGRQSDLVGLRVEYYAVSGLRNRGARAR